MVGPAVVGALLPGGASERQMTVQPLRDDIETGFGELGFNVRSPEVGELQYCPWAHDAGHARAPCGALGSSVLRSVLALVVTESATVLIGIRPEERCRIKLMRLRCKHRGARLVRLHLPSLSLGGRKRPATVLAEPRIGIVVFGLAARATARWTRPRHAARGHLRRDDAGGDSEDAPPQ
jgi:hypothetical protein